MSRTWGPPCSSGGRGGSLALPIREFSAMSLATLGEEEIIDTVSVSSDEQVTKRCSYMVAARLSHRATGCLAFCRWGHSQTNVSQNTA